MDQWRNRLEELTQNQMVWRDQDTQKNRSRSVWIKNKLCWVNWKISHLNAEELGKIQKPIFWIEKIPELFLQDRNSSVYWGHHKYELKLIEDWWNWRTYPASGKEQKFEGGNKIKLHFFSLQKSFAGNLRTSSGYV